ncbi:MAG: hypothetical protein WC956_10260 [bacterium]
MNRFWKWIIIPAVSMAFFGAACGGGGTAGGEGGDASAAAAAGDPLASYTSAMEALKAGKVREANDLFSAAIAGAQALGAGKADLDLNAILGKSHIGRAITGLLLIQESQAVTDILDGFGQSPWLLSSFFGPTGYLSQQYANHGAQAVDLHVAGAETMDFTRPFGVSTAFAVDDLNIHEQWYQGYALDIDKGFPAGIVFSFSSQIIPLVGTTDAPCEYGAGSVITPAMKCVIKENGVEKLSIPILSNVTAGTFKINYVKSTGSMTINQIGTQPGETTSVTFTDMTLFDINDNVATLNGTFTDTISDGKGPTLEGFPFRYCSKKTGVRCAMASVMPGYRSGSAIASLDAVGTQLDIIIDDLSSAASDPAAAFDVPKEFLFSDRDTHINHTDIVAMQAASLFARSGIHLVNSWTMDMDLSGMYDEEGKFIGNKAQIVHELNQFFRLREDHQLTQARDRLAAAFAAAAQALTEAAADSGGTVLVVDANNAQLYAELSAMLSSGSAAMGASSAIAGLDPQLTVDLTGVFEAKVNGADIQSDPFVLENDRIRPVEAYFVSLMQNVCSYDLNAHPPVKAFSDTVRSMSRLWVRYAFPAFMKTRVGGLPYLRYYF